MNTKAKPEGFHTITPTIIVQGAMEAVKFYEQVFGAKVKRIFQSSDNKVGHAELEIGDSILMLSDEFPMMHILSPKSPGGGTSSMYIYVDNSDDIFNKAVTAGATVTMPLTDAFWGDRCGSIIDPFGHSWTIATHIKDISDEDIEKALKDTFK